MPCALTREGGEGGMGSSPHSVNLMKVRHRLVEACQTPARTFRMEARGIGKQAGEMWHSKSSALRTLATVDDDDGDSLRLIFRTTSLGKVVPICWLSKGALMMHISCNTLVCHGRMGCG